MGKKKSKKRIAISPWCWYCERDFEDEKILINHQKAKHFKCPHCSKRLNTAQGMVIHVAQVHKENISRVPNAMAGRQDPQVDVFGSDGIPEEDRRRYEERLGVTQQTPNAPMGVDPMALKQQLEQHRNMQRQFVRPPPLPPPQYMRPPVPQLARPPPPPQQLVRPPPPVPPPRFIRPPVPPMLENNNTGKPPTVSPNATHQNVREKKKTKSAQLVYSDTKFSVVSIIKQRQCLHSILLITIYL